MEKELSRTFLGMPLEPKWCNCMPKEESGIIYRMGEKSRSDENEWQNKE